MSLFSAFKYSAILFFLRRHRQQLFRAMAVLAFAGITSLLYGDLVRYLEVRHPGALLYALIAKVIIVYGAFLFVLWQFRPSARQAAAEKESKESTTPGVVQDSSTNLAPAIEDRLADLESVDRHDRLKSRYQQLLEKESPDSARK